MYLKDSILHPAVYDLTYLVFSQASGAVFSSPALYYVLAFPMNLITLPFFFLYLKRIQFTFI